MVRCGGAGLPPQHSGKQRQEGHKFYASQSNTEATSQKSIYICVHTFYICKLSPACLLACCGDLGFPRMVLDKASLRHNTEAFWRSSKHSRQLDLH